MWSLLFAVFLSAVSLICGPRKNTKPQYLQSFPNLFAVFWCKWVWNSPKSGLFNHTVHRCVVIHGLIIHSSLAVWINSKLRRLLTRKSKKRVKISSLEKDKLPMKDLEEWRYKKLIFRSPQKGAFECGNCSHEARRDSYKMNSVLKRLNWRQSYKKKFSLKSLN